MKLSWFDYCLPEELIAYTPTKNRQNSKMMVVFPDRSKGEIRQFTSLIDYLSAGDCLVINDTKVIPARLFGNKQSGAKIEILLLEELQKDVWKVMAKPTKRFRVGSKVFISSSQKYYTVVQKNGDGTCLVKFCEDTFAILQAYGSIALPPYIKRKCTREDKQRYQTVYAKNQGAVAAPTAGLHFTDKILETLQKKGVHIIRVTLHVGAGTFLPVVNEDITQHKMHSEFYVLSKQSADIINQVKEKGKKVFAVGTTSVRLLESCAVEGKVQQGRGSTDIFLYPPYKMKIIDGLLTNFHFPKSTLLMLVACLVPRKKLLALYQQAVEEKMRFFSYGDCMLILPKR